MPWPPSTSTSRISAAAPAASRSGPRRAELSDRAGYLWWDDEPLIDVTEISLPGAHNRANAMAVAAACLARGIDRDAVAAGLRTFPGVAHRLELIATRDGVAFVNDSKATNVASTLVALRSYAGGIHLIAGGRGKRQDFSPLAPVVGERCRAVYLIGEAAEELEAGARAGRDPDPPGGRAGRRRAGRGRRGRARGHRAALTGLRQL